MPKNRDKKKSQPPATPQDAGQASATTPMGVGPFAAGLVLIIVAIVCASALAFARLDYFTLPGCGANSGCAGAANSVFGKIPIPGLEDGWSVSFLGLAYFLAVGGGWLLSKRGISAGFKAILVLGAMGSLFWTSIMVTKSELFCQYCLGVHLANFALVALALAVGGRGRNTVPAVATVAIGMLVWTGVIVGVDSWSTGAAMAEAEREADESIEELLQSTPDQGSATTATTRPAGAGSVGDTTAWQTAEHQIWSGKKVYKQDWADGWFTGNYLIGEPDAPIRVVVFSSYQCKDCQRVEKEIMAMLNTRDDVSFSHMHFPFAHPCNPRIPADNPRHPNSCWGSIATEIAGQLYGPQGFWEIHNWLFERGGGFTPAELNEFLDGVGWDKPRFNRLMQNANNKPYVDEAKADVMVALDLGLMYTPMMFVNGVQIRGFRTPNVLTRAVEALATKNPPRATAANDRPAGKLEKYVGDWEHQPMQATLGRDRFIATKGATDAPIRITAFMSFGHEMAARLNGEINEAISGRDDISLTLRHFALGKACNPIVQTFDLPETCHMTKMAEATGRLHGAEAYFRVHEWLMANVETYKEEGQRPLFHDALAGMGFDVSALIAESENMEVRQAIEEDARFLKRLNQPSFALVFVNGKRVPRWVLDGENVVQGIVDHLTTKNAG